MVGVSGPTAPKAAQIAAFMGAFVVGTSNSPDLVAAFSIIFLSGLILVGISFLRISHFIHYIPYSVVAGFMCGIGIIVILTQINSFIGLQPEKNIHDVFNNLSYSFRNINIQALYVAIPSILVLFLWDSIARKNKFLESIPSPLLALILGTTIAYLLKLDIPYIGDKMGSTDSFSIFSFYWPDFSRIFEFVGPAFALAGLAVLDSLLSCVVADNMTGERHSSDRETFGQGMANMAAGLFGGVTTATATMRTVANIKFGGKTPLASIVHGITLLAILLGLGFLVEAIPLACLAAILFKVGVDILDYRILPVVKKLPLTDLFVFIIVLFVTVYEDLLIAVAIGVFFSFVRSFKDIKLAINAIYKHEIVSISKTDFMFKKINSDQIKNRSINVLQLNGPLFFGSTEDLIKIYSDSDQFEVLIVDMSKVTMVDLSGVFALEDLINKIKGEGSMVFVFNENIKIKNILNNLNFIENIGPKYYKDSKDLLMKEISNVCNLN